MVLNLVALAGMAGAVGAAFILLRRYLPRGMSGGANVCLLCGGPAAALSSFMCPSCGHDVRDAGIGPLRGRSPLTTFWVIVVFSCGYLIAAQLLIAVVLNHVPRAYRVARNISMRVSSPEIHAVDLYLDAQGPDERSRAGRITGELYAAGGVVVLEVELPARTWRLVNLNGAALDAGDRLDGSAVYRWMERAGVPVDSPVAHSDAAHIANSVGQFAGARLEMPPVPGTGRALALSYSSSSGGGSSRQADPRWRPALVIVASAIWLTGVWVILASRRTMRARPAPHKPAPVAQGVAS